MIHGIFLMHRIYPWFQGDLNRLLYFCQRGNWNQGKGKCKSWRFPVKLLLEWYPGQKRQKKKPKHPKIARTSFLGGLCDNLKNFPFEDEASLHNLWAFLSDDNTIGVNLLYHLSNIFGNTRPIPPQNPVTTALYNFSWCYGLVIKSSHDLLLCHLLHWELSYFIALMVDVCAREVY